MITLTTPVQINSVLGGNAPIGYDKLVVSPINYDPVGGRVAANLRLSSSSTPAMQTLLGDLSITLSTSELVVQMPAASFYRKVALNPGQVASVQGFINTAQNNIEGGLLSLGIVPAGTQTTGI